VYSLRCHSFIRQPAIYTIEDIKIIEGPDIPINELASFTHTYAGQVKEGEKVIAKGKMEKVINKKQEKQITD